MTAEEISILFSPEVPLDLFSSSVIVPVYDTEKNATTGEEVEIFLPYNAVERPWIVSPRDKLERWLYQKLSSEKYIIYIPEYKGERFSLLASREGRRFLIVLGLESEEEKSVACKGEFPFIYSSGHKGQGSGRGWCCINLSLFSIGLF